MPPMPADVRGRANPPQHTPHIRTATRVPSGCWVTIQSVVVKPNGEREGGESKSSRWLALVGNMIGMQGGRVKSYAA